MNAAFVKPDDYKSPDTVQVLYDAETIAAAQHRLAAAIRRDLGEEFLIVGLLKGSFVFIADLVRALHQLGCTPQIDFMTISSYGENKESSGKLVINGRFSDPLEGKPVLLVDDILESGRTLHFAKAELLKHGAASVHLCVLLDKPGKRKEKIDADFVGFDVPDRFVVGYGLDYAGYYRELPFIGTLD